MHSYLVLLKDVKLKTCVMIKHSHAVKSVIRAYSMGPIVVYCTQVNAEHVASIGFEIS